MNDYPHLTAWCADYSKKTGVKIYPQSAPLQLVLEDVVARMVYLEEMLFKFQKENIENAVSILEATNLLNKIKEDKKPIKKEDKK
jgi:hypothetical protein